MNICSWDTETKGLDWFDPDQRVFLFTWSTDEGNFLAHIDKPDEIQAFKDALINADKIVAHNFSFDYNQVKATIGFDIFTDTNAGRNGSLYDTDLMSRVLLPEQQRDGRGGFGLKNLAARFIDKDADKEEDDIKRMAKASGIKLKSTGGYYETWRAYPDVMEAYALKDSEYTLKLFNILERMLDKNPAAGKVLDTLEHPCMPVLIRAEHRGIRLDPEKVNDLIKQYEEIEKEKYDYLSSELGDEALGGTGSEDALLEALQMIGVPLYRKTQTGQIATNKFALQEFEKDFPQLEALGEWRTARKFLATYLGPMKDRDTVHTNFRQIGAWTGRMSSARPNMQNIPSRAGSEVREMFIPRPGKCFVVADYDSIEIRILAYYLNEPEFIEMIEEGHDPHAWMASQIYGGTMNDYLKGTAGEKQRAIAKNTLFAIIYGAGAPRVADMNEISKEDAKALIATIKSSLPGYRKLDKRVKSKIKQTGFVSTLFGRVNQVNREKAYVGLNALIQGSAADVMKKAVVDIPGDLRDEGCWDSEILLVVHDEVVVECPIEEPERVQKIVESAMIGAYDLKPGLKVSSKIVYNNYAEAK